MPWTFAHPAAILPLRKLFPQRLHFLALLIGSLTPDFGYYIGQSAFSGYSHSFPGLLVACTPIGFFLLYFLFFTGRYFSVILPEPHRSAFLYLISGEKLNSFSSRLLLLVAIWLGALTHLLWDSFTHPWGWLVKHSETLSGEILRFGSLKIYGYTLLQHSSTLVGIAILFVSYISWLKRNNMGSVFTVAREDCWRYRLIGIVLLVSVAISLPIAYLHTSRFSGALAISAFVVDFAFVITPVVFVVLTISVLYINFIKIRF